MASTPVKAPAQLRDIIRDASLLAAKRAELEQARRENKREWSLNREFYKGNQWAWWNEAQFQIEALPPVVETSEGRHKVRLVSNQILPGVQNIIAQLTKTRPVIHATPNSGSERDAKAAELAENLFEYWWHEFHMQTKLQRALLHAQISEGYWKISWDPYAGKKMTIMLDPETGAPVTDMELADAYKDQIEAMARAQQQDPAEILAQVQKTIMLGDIKVEVLSGEQVLVDPTVSDLEYANFVICTHPMDPEEIKARWGVSVTADSAPQDLAFPASKTTVPKKITKDVYVGYFKPSMILPKGRYVAWVEGPNKILAQSDWPYPFNDLPLIKFPGTLNPDTSADAPRVSQARGLNKELNRTISQIVMHKNLTLKPQMVAPVGSLRQRITDEPGAVFEYQPIAGLAPEWRQLPGLPQYVFEHLSDIQRRIDTIFNKIPTERNSLPPRVDAGYTVELLQEAVADQLSPEIGRIEMALAQAGMLMLQLAQKYYIEPRLLKIQGIGGSTQIKKFMNSDLEGGFGLRAEAGSGLPQTKAGRMMQIKELVQMQAISPADALPYLGISNLSGIAKQMAGDEDQAYREIEKLLLGQPTNPMAAQQAVQAIQSGQPNPQTGQPFASQEEAQAFIMSAAFSPLPWENLGVHIRVLQEYMVTPEFEKYSPEIQQRFIQHFSLTQQTMAQQAAQQSAPGQPVRTTLSLKGTVGPTVAAEILNKSGVPQATPEQFTEAPLETSVYDSMDLPDQDVAGNDPLSEQDMQMTAQTMSLQAAKGAHEMALTQQRMTHTEQSAQQSDQAHQQKLSHAEEIHQAKLQQMRQQAQRPPGGEGGG